MKHTKRKSTTLLTTLCMICFLLISGSIDVHAKSNYSAYELKLTRTSMTLYVNETHFLGAGVSGPSSNDFDEISNKIKGNLTWKSSNPSIIGFVTDTGCDTEGNTTYQTSGSISPEDGRVTLLALKEGTSTITVKSSVLNKSYKCKITVKNAELTCDDDVYYEKNTYNFSVRGNATGICYSSSNPKVAVIDEKTGVVTTKKKGETTLSCVADDGKTYTYKLTVNKRGLSYTKLTTYYYTGLSSYHHFPLVAKGIDVKKWKSSNNKVCKVKKIGNIGLLEMRRTGNATITCIGKDGKQYKCKLTVAGGKTWGGLNGGYRPKLSTVKKHGYFKDINAVMDYGNVVVCILETENEFSLKNGNKHLSEKQRTEAEMILKNRYPNSTVHRSFSDHLIFTNDSGEKTGRISYYYYYVD